MQNQNQLKQLINDFRSLSKEQQEEVLKKIKDGDKVDTKETRFCQQ